MIMSNSFNIETDQIYLDVKLDGTLSKFTGGVEVFHVLQNAIFNNFGEPSSFYVCVGNQNKFEAKFNFIRRSIIENRYENFINECKSAVGSGIIVNLDIQFTTECCGETIILTDNKNSKCEKCGKEFKFNARTIHRI